MDHNHFHSTHAEKPRIKNYQLLSLLGEGGMGKVYKAFDVKSQSMVAIKVLQTNSQDNISSIKRFFKEVHAISTLDHPNIIRLYDSGQHNGIPYFVMEFIAGVTLRDWLEKKTSIRKRLAMMRKIISAMEYAHERGLIHRDLKPDNVMVREDNEPCVMDFGLAKFRDDTDNLTHTGGILGTLHYMSPEQAEGRKREIDHRTDIYALGAILYECITKKPPFIGANATAIIKKICCEPVIPPSAKNANISKDLDKICLKALAKNPVDRYENLQQFLHDIDSFSAGKKLKTRIPKKKNFVLPMIIAICVLIVASIFLFSSSSSPKKTPTFPKQKIETFYYNLKSQVSSGIDIQRQVENKQKQWGKYAFFHQKIAQLYFYRAYNSGQLQENMDRMKKHIDTSMVLHKDPYNVLLLYQNALTKREIPKTISAKLVTNYKQIARRLPNYDETQDALSQVEEHIHSEWLYATQFARKVQEATTRANILTPFRHYQQASKNVVIDDYTLFIRGKRVSKVGEGVYLAAIEDDQVRYLAVRSDGRMVEVYIDVSTLEVIRYQDMGTTPQVRGSKVKWQRLSEMLEILSVGFVKSFYKKNYVFLFPNNKQREETKFVSSSSRLKSQFRLNLDRNNPNNSLYLYYKRHKINRENEYVMVAGIAKEHVLYLFMTPQREIREVYYDYRNRRRIKENTIMQLNSQNTQMGIVYLQKAFVGYAKSYGYSVLQIK